MIVSAHQPAYLPWLGYFDKIARSDVFVIFDSVQFEKNSFINRNRIKTANGLHWLTVPVKASNHFQRGMCDLEIANEHDWKHKHLKSIAQNYGKAEHFADCFAQLEQLFAQEDRTLVGLCMRHLHFWMEQLKIATPLRLLSELGVAGTKSDLVLAVCKALGATRYVSGALGRDYLNLSAFAAAGIDVEFQAYQQPIYPQLYGDFVPYLSVVDFWMNTAPSASAIFRGTENESARAIG